MSKFKNSILRELGIKESSLPPSAVREDAFPGIDPENQDDSMEPQPTDREKMLSPTAIMPQVLAVSVKGSTTGGLPSGKNMSRGKLGGYEPISNAKENSLVVNKTPDSKLISNPAPIANDGGTETTPAAEHPHQTQTATDEPPQAITGASQEDDTSLKLSANVPKGIDVDVAEENCGCEEESPEKMNEVKGIPFEQLIAVRQSLQEKAQKGTMSKKESEVFSSIAEVLQKRGLGLEEKLFGKKSMLETAGVRKNAIFDKDKKCTHPNGFEWSGRTPNTGYKVCRMCGQREKTKKKPLNELTKLSTEELQSIWEDDKDGEYIQIDDNGTAHYVAHGSAMEQIPPQYGSVWKGIDAWMKAKQYFPNIWHVNERGNVTLMSRNGRSMGGLV